ncbi:MAG: TonB-dependent receptor [Muribaculaceae bacterium]|nr:TonB-dependent receptor [Muribaculaceae bacterium]
MTKILLTTTILMSTASLAAQTVVSEPDSIAEWELEEFTLEKKRAGNLKLSGPENAFQINQTELFRAACCNLGESFTTNPSVDVNYSDPGTGAKQIKLLGLSGSYVQLLAENMPDFRGAARPYALRYVPGPWMKSISVSKGSASVKNGFESMSGQIDVEYLKPDDPAGVAVNAYVDSDLKLEANVDANTKLTPNLATEFLAHFEDRFMSHDGNDDGFADMPDIRQVNLFNRWKYVGPKYIFHGGVGFLDEKSEAGEIVHSPHIENPYRIYMKTDRVQAYMKHAFILDRQHNSNIALMANGSFHSLDASYGLKAYNVDEWNGYAQLIFETDFNDRNSISAGFSFNHDSFYQHLRTVNDASLTMSPLDESENTFGGYAQYTWKPSDKITAMAGIRGDHSSLYGWFATPRCNIRFTPVDNLNFRVSVGKGYRTVFGWAEYNYLLASGRQMVVENLNQEASWNYGINADYTLWLGSHFIRFNADYYFTNFDRQVNVDYDSNPHTLTIANLQGRSYSHTFQIDATYESSFGLSVTAAYRLNDVKTTFGGKLLEKPLTPKYKALLTASFSTEMDIWQFDATLAFNGGGRMPAPYQTAEGTYSWPERFKAFPQLNMQVTRWFRHFSIYAGGENLTGFRQKNPIICSSNPWSSNFDSTMIWGPVQGAMAYIGIRLNFGKL